jgi:hypothetical protein
MLIWVLGEASGVPGAGEMVSGVGVAADAPAAAQPMHAEAASTTNGAPDLMRDRTNATVTVA